MPESELTRLRRARSRCHFRLKQAEELAESYRVKLADLESRIQAIAPDLQLPVRFRRPNPHFARGELPRLVLRIMREAGEPLGVAQIAVRALAMKGEPLPGPTLRKRVRVRVRCVVAKLEGRGVVVTVGRGKGTKRVLATVVASAPRSSNS